MHSDVGCLCTPSYLDMLNCDWSKWLCLLIRQALYWFWVLSAFDAAILILTFLTLWYVPCDFKISFPHTFFPLHLFTVEYRNKDKGGGRHAHGGLPKYMVLIPGLVHLAVLVDSVAPHPQHIRLMTRSLTFQRAHCRRPRLLGIAHIHQQTLTVWCAGRAPKAQRLVKMLLWVYLHTVRNSVASSGYQIGGKHCHLLAYKKLSSFCWIGIVRWAHKSDYISEENNSFLSRSQLIQPPTRKLSALTVGS